VGVQGATRWFGAERRRFRQAAIEAELTVAWFTIEDLGALVRLHRVDDSITRALARLIRTLATATVDRLLHLAHVVVTQGDNFRLAQAHLRAGVGPLH
jgi:hypothetical protein